jgi:hypothetical protein
MQSPTCYLIPADFLLALFFFDLEDRTDRSLKHQFSIIRLHNIIFYKIDLFITTAVRKSNPM